MAAVAPADANDDEKVVANSLCCQVIVPRAAVAKYMLSDDTDRSPSLFSRCCFLQCAPERRTASALPDALRGLTGLTLQKGEHSTAGSLQTLKFSRWDAPSRTATMPVFGAFGAPATSGLWTEPNTPTWNCLITFARSCNYSYDFKFSEDFRRADIGIRGNCCCCVPCAPACVSVPGFIARFDMVQADSSTDGSSWIRSSSSCGGPMKRTYDLVEVVRSDLTPGPFHGDLALRAPKNLLLSR